MRISSSFDSGSIDIIAAEQPSDIRLALRADNAADFRQWFHFRLQGAAGKRCRIRILNASASSYPDGWADYKAVASYDHENWFRVSGTSYDGRALTIDIQPELDSIYFAYFQPYSWERHLQLLGRADSSSVGTVSDLGGSVEGRDINLVTVGRPARKRKTIWVVARQHPGETMAEWFVEGMLEHLFDAADPVSRRLLHQACFRIVPNMNPDGSVRGNLRTNAAGCNLNRAWAAPDMQTSPEVFQVREAMARWAPDVFLDIHGDETLPYVFVDGNSMLPSYSSRQAELEKSFSAALLAATPDFQTQYGYAADRFGPEMLTLASKWVGERFGCLSLTLEMPFKDNADLRDGVEGWSAERSKRLARAVLAALQRMLAP